MTFSKDMLPVLSQQVVMKLDEKQSSKPTVCIHELFILLSS